jgi:hypothetical protein
MRVGGGAEKVAKDIHWHVAAKVWYVASDSKRQEIEWVGIDTAGLPLVEYVDPRKTTPISTKTINEEKRLMDCMDCHNRATHIFSSPEQLIDEAIARAKIDRSLPFIKREGLSALNPPSPTLEQAGARIASIRDFYRNSYPKVFQEKSGAITKALQELNEISRLTNFPVMKANWASYFDNAGHQDTPGCLRCHGKLVAKGGATAGKTINAACDSCHYFDLKQVLK